jgi:hypothetical protein
VYPEVSGLSHNEVNNNNNNNNKHSLRIERIVLLDFIHRLVSQKTNKIEELKI